MKTSYQHLALLLVLLSFAKSLNAEIAEPAAELQMACFSIVMHDSFGDGWDGATYTIYNWNGNYITSGGLESGSDDYDYLCLPDGCYTIEVTAGYFPSEITWELITDYIFIDGYAPSTFTFTLGTPVYGCTDSSACNYDPNANCDYGTCCYGSCLYLYCYDSFGDGWNDAYITIENNVGEELIYNTVTAAEGGFDYTFLCADAGCYHVTVTAGSFPSEISWELYIGHYNSGYTVLTSGGAPNDFFVGIGATCSYEKCANPAACNYSTSAAYQSAFCCLDYCGQFIMHDTYGDGWNNAQYSIIDHTDKVVQSGTLNYGEFGKENLCLPDGCYTLVTTECEYAYEGAWEMGVSNAYLSGVLGQSQNFSVGTIINGCTDSCAANFNPLANCDDGSCTVTCDSDLDGNGTVNVGDLLIFTSQFGMVCN